MPEHKVNLARCCLDDVLAPEPIGHRGQWYQQQPPAWSVGDVLVFTVYGDEEKARGVVQSVEQVPHGEEWGGWYRMGWREFAEVT